jgi:Capsular polysaccharide biosynthesis protein
MEGFIDIHSHILPNLDDGAKSMQMAANMARIAEKEGIRTIIVTPHYHERRSKLSYQDIEKCRQKLQSDASIQAYNINFHIGCEVYYSHDCMGLLNSREIPTLAGSRYVLVECSTSTDLRQIKMIVNEFLMEGYLPILAHVERYPSLCSDLDNIEEIINQGAYIQINAASIMGKNGFNAKKTARKILKYRMVHFVATDSHSDRRRVPRLKKCAKYIARKHGEDWMKELLISNPNKIINNVVI